MLARHQVSTVWPSHSAADLACQGASIGTSLAIMLRRSSASMTSAATARSVAGMEPE